MSALEPDTLVLTRRLDAAPARVFRAWSDGDEYASWAVPGEGWVEAEREWDFREGGVQRSLFGPEGAPSIESLGRFVLIAPDRRIVSTGTMRDVARDVVSAATMMTLDLVPAGTGTALTLIDQSVFLGEGETPEMRRAGWDWILDRLADHLAAAARLSAEGPDQRV